MKRIGCLIMCLLMLCATAWAAEVPYVQEIPAGLPIYEDPGYVADAVASVPEAGMYTIVEEVTDGSGRLWGRLKSGAGWVDLTRLQGGSLIFAELADLSMTANMSCYTYEQEQSEHTTYLLLRTMERVENVQLVSFQWTEAGLQLDQVMYARAEWSADMPLLAGVVFYGDMTTYGLMCTDSQGNQRCYTLTISGEDGSPVLTECALTATPLE